MTDKLGKPTILVMLNVINFEMFCHILMAPSSTKLFTDIIITLTFYAVLYEVLSMITVNNNKLLGITSST